MMVAGIPTENLKTRFWMNTHNLHGPPCSI